MRKLLLLATIGFLVLLSCVVVAGFAAHWASSMNDMRVTVDGETLDGSAIAAIVGGAAFLGTLIACLAVFALLASIAIVIPVILIAIALALMFAIFAGLAPIAIPVLLVVGACVLLSRRSRRRAGVPIAPSLSPKNATEPPISPA